MARRSLPSMLPKALDNAQGGKPVELVFPDLRLTARVTLNPNGTVQLSGAAIRALSKGVKITELTETVENSRVILTVI